MSIEIKVPAFPESITEGEIASWHFAEGDAIAEGDIIVEVETDKVVMEVPATENGVLTKIDKPEGATVTSQETIGSMEAGEAPVKPAKAEETAASKEPTKSEEAPKAEQSTPTPQEKVAAPKSIDASPSVRRMAAEQGLDASAFAGKKLSKAELLKLATEGSTGTSGRIEKREPMSRLRKTVAQRLLDVQQNTAMLTTFNEVDMKAVMDLRQAYKDQFEKVYGVKLGFMSFFLKAASEALKLFPAVNASIDGSDIVYHGYNDISVAVSSPRGLVVPVVRNVQQLSMADIESQIRDFALKAKAGTLSIEDMQGGTFTITNGGVFGSMLSTPILNAPQSAILGMHNIVERPVALDGQVVIRPIMYLALSYDHRIIDGRESVSFLKTIKEYLENPARIILEV